MMKRLCFAMVLICVMVFCLTGCTVRVTKTGDVSNASDAPDASEVSDASDASDAPDYSQGS